MFSVGQPVDVWCEFTGRWSHGFEVHAIEDGRVVLRNASDGLILSRPFSEHDLRVQDVHHLVEGHNLMR